MTFNAIHHGYELFVKGLNQLKPVVQELSKKTRIVWVQQAQIVTASSTKWTDYITSLPHYNSAMRSILKWEIRFVNVMFWFCFFNVCILKRDSGVEIWDSADPVALQYVRSCLILERMHSQAIWHNCLDAIHTGPLINFNYKMKRGS